MHAKAYQFAVVLLLFRNLEPLPLTTRQWQSQSQSHALTCTKHKKRLRASLMILSCWIHACSYACKRLLIRCTACSFVVVSESKTPAPDNEAIAKSESDFGLHQAHIEAQGLFDDFELLDPCMLLCMQRLPIRYSFVVIREPKTLAPDNEAIAESESNFALHQAQIEAQGLLDDFEVLKGVGSMHALMHAKAYQFVVVLFLFRNPGTLPLTTRQLQSQSQTLACTKHK